MSTGILVSRILAFVGSLISKFRVAHDQYVNCDDEYASSVLQRQLQTAENPETVRQRPRQETAITRCLLVDCLQVD